MLFSAPCVYQSSSSFVRQVCSYPPVGGKNIVSSFARVEGLQGAAVVSSNDAGAPSFVAARTAGLSPPVSSSWVDHVSFCFLASLTLYGLLFSFELNMNCLLLCSLL